MPTKTRDPYAKAKPKRVRRGAPLRERLTRPGAMPDPVPPAVLGVLATFQGATNRLVEVMTKWADSPVLTAGTFIMPASGVWCFDTDVPVKSMQLRNLSAHTMTVAPGGPGDPSRPPDRGAGVHVVLTSKSVIGALEGTSVSVYGTAGDQFGFSAFSTWVAPAG
jgi:hypothetical protein